MKNFLVLSLSIGIMLAVLVIPAGKASAIILGPGQPGAGTGNALDCPQKGFSASFSFDTTTLVRGADNTINFTVQNNSGEGGWFNSVAFGTPMNLGINVVEPEEGVGGPSINTGPWQIIYVNGGETTGELGGYDGVVWTTLAEVNDTGFAPIKPCTQETFNVKINVPKSVPLGQMNVAVAGGQLNIKDPNATQTAASIVPFTVTDSAVTTLPKTGFDTIAWTGGAALLIGLPALFRRRKKA